MATTLILRQIAADPIFQSRVRHFMLITAKTVVEEALATVGHTARVAYANTVVLATASVEAHAIAVVGQSAVSGVANLGDSDNGISDSILATAVSDTWNVMANVETGA